MRKLLLSLLLVSGVAHADNEMAYIKNNGGGYIFFTYSDCVYLNNNQRVPNKFYVYSTNEKGSRIADGCFEYKPPFYIIDWNSGNRSSIPLSNVELIGR